MNIQNIPVKNFVVIGSLAGGYREAKDIDIVCYEKDIQTEYNRRDDFSGSFDFEGRRVELLFADQQDSFKYLLDHCGEGKLLCPIHYLHAIKRGHIMFPSKNWEKHMNDLYILSRIMTYSGAIVNTDFINLHKKSTEFRLGSRDKTPRLKNVTKESFFDDNVKKYVEHDDIHFLFRHKDKPMYSYMQRDESLVECHRDLWDKFSYEDKINCVLEEAYVISSERRLIPTLKGDAFFTDPHASFKWALMRVCTTLCSGWFRSFAINNYIQILNSYDKEYYKKLEQLN